MRVADVARRPFSQATLAPAASIDEMARTRGEFSDQAAFPVVDPAGKLLGIVGASAIGFAVADAAAAPPTVAADLMQPVPAVRGGDDLRKVAELFVSSGLRQLPVLDGDGRIEAVIDESDVARAYLKLVAGQQKSGPPT